jgi:hypothetical protein
VVPARSSVHGLSCSRRSSPLSGRNSTYRTVQISGTGSALYDFSPDLRWSQLSNILSVGFVPITLDGYALVQKRSQSASAEPGKIASFGENIHRYWDEAPFSDLGVRLHSLDNKRLADQGQVQPVDHNYIPQGVPSPLLAFQRGVAEELSRRIYELTMSDQANYKFLGLLFGLRHFRPALCGIVELGVTLSEAQRIIGEDRGKDHWEHNRIIPLALDPTAPEIQAQIANDKNWIDVGLGALILAIKFCKSRSKS